MSIPKKTSTHKAKVFLVSDNKGKTPKALVKQDNRELFNISSEKTCNCKPYKINCLTAKEWLKCQLGVWSFNYSKYDVRDKNIHPATFPISLAKKVVGLFSHEGELVLDPFTGSGTVNIAAQELARNSIGVDLKKEYVDLACKRLSENPNAPGGTRHVFLNDDAIALPKYLRKDSIKCIFTSPPYAHLLNRKRKNKSRRFRKNGQLNKIEQYSQDPKDLGTMEIDKYNEAIGDIFESLLPFLKPKGHCVINVPDMWWENSRITLHIEVVNEMRKRGYELRNIIIWDRTNLVNQIGIFGWPSNYITMGVTYEYLLDFWKPPIDTKK